MAQSMIGRLKVVVLKYPLVGNMVMTGAIFYSGDISRQTIQNVDTYDHTSAKRMGVYGGCIAAPLMFYFYKALDAYLPGASVRTVVKKVVLDQGIGGGIGIPLFYTCMSIMEGKQEIFKEAKEKGPRTFLVGCVFWPTVQCFNFAFLPPSARTLYFASAAFIWTNILSFIKAMSHDFAEIAGPGSHTKELHIDVKGGQCKTIEAKSA